MQKGSILINAVFRNAVGLGVLLGVHFFTDHANMFQHTRLNNATPYFFLLLIYGWIVFHNRVLFEKLFLRDKKPAYFGWTLLVMMLCSLIIHYFLRTGFNFSNTLPHIVRFWIYTVAGLGAFLIWRYIRHIKTPQVTDTVLSVRESPQVFSCMIDGFPKEIRYEDIHYIESIENYIRIVTSKKPLIVRISLKDTELRLPAPPFIRISRCCIVNSNHIEGKVGETLMIHGNELKVGKVFKRYVEKFLK